MEETARKIRKFEFLRKNVLTNRGTCGKLKSTKEKSWKYKRKHTKEGQIQKKILVPQGTEERSSNYKRVVT